MNQENIQQRHEHVKLDNYGMDGGYSDDNTIAAYKKLIRKIHDTSIMFSLQSSDSNNYYKHSERLSKIVKELEKALQSECRHEYVENDYIDIDVERGTNISYCTKCYMTFTSLKI